MNDPQLQIIKLGSGLFRLLGFRAVCALVAEQVAPLWLEKNVKTLVISSGAKLCGEREMGTAGKGVVLKETLASVGQPILMSYYRQSFRAAGMRCSQVLVTDASIMHRREWGHTKRVIEDGLSHGIVPIINENDAVSGKQFLTDNDQLTVLVSEMLKPVRVFFITQSGGVFDGDPAKVGSRQFREIDFRNPPDIKDGISENGTGGIREKMTHAISCYREGTCQVGIIGLTAESIRQSASGYQVPTVIGTTNSFVEL